MLGSQYLGPYIGPWEDIDEWVRPNVDPWNGGIIFITKVATRHPKTVYSGIGMSLQLECQYHKNTVPKVGFLMGAIKRALREALFHDLFGGEEVGNGMR